MDMKKRVSIIANNLICETNTKYYSTLEKYFKSNGWEIAADFNADLVVFSTCGFSDNMYKAIKGALDELKTLKFPGDNIIMMGCLSKTHGEYLNKEFTGKRIEFGEEHRLDDIIGARVHYIEINGTNVFKAPGDKEESSKEELFNIQIADGCLKQCTFCIVNKAHGDLRSMPLKEITAQYELAIKKGYRNINLVGTDILGYGYDNGTNIVELIEHLLKIDANVNFYLGSLHSRWLKLYWDQLLEFCKRKIINSLHAVVQHTNDEILKKMGRPISFSETYGIICRFKQECPDVFLSTDVIVGFPGETDEMFNEMLEVFKKDQCFSLINHYQYSDVKGAPAFNFKDKVSDPVKQYRWNVFNAVLGERSPLYALNKYESAKYRRYRGVFNNRYNTRGYNFCVGTYEEI